jgi:hypothetical protein
VDKSVIKSHANELVRSMVLNRGNCEDFFVRVRCLVCFTLVEGIRVHQAGTSAAGTGGRAFCNQPGLTKFGKKQKKL